MDKVYWQIDSRGLVKTLYLGKGTFFTTVKGVTFGSKNIYFYIKYPHLYDLYGGDNFLNLSLEEILEKVLTEKPSALIAGKRQKKFISVVDESYEALKFNKPYSFEKDDIVYTLTIDEY